MRETHPAICALSSCKIEITGGTSGKRGEAAAAFAFCGVSSSICKVCLGFLPRFDMLY
jgi:hypothetical protein